MTALAARLRRFDPDGARLRWVLLLVAVEAALVGAHLLRPDVTITDPLVLVYPFVWLNVGLWAVASTTPAAASRRVRRAGIAVGVAYFLVLSVAGGMVAPGHALHGHAHATGLRIATSLPPGWGPAVLYGGGLVRVNLFPYKLAGYLALSYLVYATVLDAAGSVLAGVVGVFSCVSCTWPVLGTVLTGLLGGSSAVAAFATGQPYAASTLVFLSAVALLSWRPTVG